MAKKSSLHFGAKKKKTCVFWLKIQMSFRYIDFLILAACNVRLMFALCRKTHLSQPCSEIYWHNRGGIETQFMKTYYLMAIGTVLKAKGGRLERGQCCCSFNCDLTETQHRQIADAIGCANLNLADEKTYKRDYKNPKPY